MSVKVAFCSSMWLFQVESRLYAESMAGATAKSKPASSKQDEKEISRLQKQDYWLQVTRAKLTMDLIFVCTFGALSYVRGANFFLFLQRTMCSGLSGRASR